MDYSFDYQAVKDLLDHLNKQGLDARHLSDILDIQRKTIYDWKDGEEIPDIVYFDRLQRLKSALSPIPLGHLRYYLRLWKRELNLVSMVDGNQITSCQSLETLLSQLDLNIVHINQAFEQLKPSVERALKTDLQLKQTEHTRSPAGSLTEYLVTYCP